MQFDTSQLKAINHGSGPALIIAGPGSGKTTVLTNRIKTLIETHHVPPEQILVITFSKAAAVEMEERFHNLCVEKFYPVTFGTFHSIFYSFLQRAYGRSLRIANNNQKSNNLIWVLKRLGIVDYPQKELIEGILKSISYYKNCKKIGRFTEETNIDGDLLLTIVEEYDRRNEAQGIIDFDDMLIKTLHLLKEDSALLRSIQDRYRYILVDECQDINIVQMEIVELMGEKYRNVYMVGDDDQSIYKFRGSNVGLLQRFENYFEDCERINLSVNYRCSDEIISAASKVIEVNKKRFPKNIRGVGRRSGEVELLKSSNRRQEDEGILDICRNIDDEHRLAILVRTNREAAYYGTLLKEAGIRCIIKTQVQNPFESVYMSDCIRYMRLAKYIHHMSINDLLPVINKPVRYVRRSDIIGDYIDIDDMARHYKDDRSMNNSILTLKYHLERLRALDMYASITYIRRQIGYDEYMMAQHGKSSAAYEKYMLDMNMIQELIRDIKSLEELQEYCLSYGEVLKEMQMSDKNEDRGVHITTYHGSKGLEYNTVILPHVNEGTVPGKNTTDIDDIEEERRMFYVAMTRAKDRLIITYVESGKEEKPSMFVRGL